MKLYAPDIHAKDGLREEDQVPLFFHEVLTRLYTLENWQETLKEAVRSLHHR